jgi:quercetin dioxygenase-like cupin family protein
VSQEAASAIDVTVVYRDPVTDVTHSGTEQIPWVDRRTALLPALSVGYLRITAGFRADWHPAPRKQYVMVLSGTMEVEAGDGERRTSTARSVLLVTDVDGRGHRTNALGSEGVFLVWVPIP